MRHRIPASGILQRNEFFDVGHADFQRGLNKAVVNNRITIDLRNRYRYQLTATCYTVGRMIGQAYPLPLRSTPLSASSAVPVVRASGRPAGHPVPDFAAADQASDLVGRPGFPGRLGLDCSCAYLDWVEVELEVTGADQTGSIGWCDEKRGHASPQ